VSHYLIKIGYSFGEESGPSPKQLVSLYSWFRCNTDRAYFSHFSFTIYSITACWSQEGCWS